MSNCNNTISEEIVCLWWKFRSYNRIVSDCLLSLPDGEELTPAIEIISSDFEEALNRILKALK